MATVTVFTAERMQEIEDNAIVGVEIVDDHLIFTRHDGSLIDAGLLAVGGSGGDVATDLIWNAADDIIVGTGSNTAERRAVPASSIIAKLAAGGLKACTPAEICTLLSVYTATETNDAITTQILALGDSAPALLNTLNELAAALGDDPDFAATITTLIGTKETPAGAQAKADAKVEDVCVDGVTTKAPSQNVVFDLVAVLTPVRGTSAALAAANAVYTAGKFIQQTDGAKLLAIGDGTTAYNSLPKYSLGEAGAYQYAYTETGNFDVGTTFEDWPGLTITFTSDGVSPIEIETICPFVRGNAGMTLPCYGQMTVMEGDTQIAFGSSSQMTVAGDSGIGATIIIKDTRVWSAGVHTIKVQIARSTVGGGTGNLSFFAFTGGFRAYIRSKLAHQ